MVASQRFVLTGVHFRLSYIIELIQDALRDAFFALSRSTSGLSMLNFKVAGFARIQFDSEKTELWRVRLHVSILIFIFDRPLG